jgi:hypothetical protein
MTTAPFDIDPYIARSGALDLSAIDWEEVPRHPLTGYRWLAMGASHPVLAALLERIVLDESRHFFFYYRHAEMRLRRPGPSRVARLLVDRFWAPVGSGVQPANELIFLARYLFGGAEGRAAARRVDEAIRRLPGFAVVKLLETWMDRSVGLTPDAKGEPHGHRDG